MKVKTLKIKIDSQCQNISIFNDLDEGVFIYNLSSALEFENGCYYWNIIIVYDMKNFNFFYKDELKNSNKNNFILEIKRYIENSNFNTRIYNILNKNINNLNDINCLNDLKCFRGLGEKSIFENKEKLLGLIELVTLKK